MSKKKISLEEHAAISEHIRQASEHLRQIFGVKLKKSSTHYKKLVKALESIEIARSSLENEFIAEYEGTPLDQGNNLIEVYYGNGNYPSPQLSK
ncbi:MAG: hypothetical protein KF752_11815 [Pirellulaceae bacterium]|nr:hypothetical protein [Pirellulaceae bacterium]